MAGDSFDLPAQLTDFDLDIATLFLLALANCNGKSGTVAFGEFADYLPTDISIGHKRQRFDNALDRVTNQILANKLNCYQQAVFSALSVDMFISSSLGLDSKATFTFSDLIASEAEHQTRLLPSLLPLIGTNSVGCIALYCELVSRPDNTDIKTVKRGRLEQLLIATSETYYSIIKQKHLIPALDSIFAVTGQRFEIMTEMKSSNTTQAVVFKEK
ncbi:hypothetical protein BIZ37_03610 [Photobacterium sp. BZF1]|uniref:hypothetical protein n=1 Tax=Photobacterium sp. BZF1 TaxID=1904457 RepID=UPI00165377D8|nr:hypothetical protein [Photobacterium sp. BZF1]MBC7001636.1 hypothetical protein [Photobacterium sp. BZF1]